MASPRSNPESLGSSSPFFPLSTPGSGTEGDRTHTWTPGTTPLGFSRPRQEDHEKQASNGKSRFQQPFGHGDIWRTHILEKQRLAAISRLGLDLSPSKSTRENGSVTVQDQVELGMKSRPSLWDIAANLSPSRSRNHVDVMPANKPFPQGPSPSNNETRNMQEPSHAADWTVSPLIPRSSFRAPLPQPLPFQNPQAPSSPWLIPTDNTKMVSAPPPTNPTMRIEHLLGRPTFFNRPELGKPTGFGVAHHQEHHFNAEASGKMQGQVPAHDYSQIQRVNPLASSFPIAAAPDAPRAFWNEKPGSQHAPVIPYASVHVPLGLRLPDVAIGLQTPTHADPTPAPASFGFRAAIEANHGPAAYNDNRSAATPTTTGTALTGDIPFYRPMNCRNAYRDHHQPSQNETHALLLKGFSPNYRGDPGIARNQSAAIPAEANCSLFIVGLAPDLTTHELLAGIRNVGRVYATHINPPSPERGLALSAAKLVFFERQGAERFHALHATTGFSTPLHPHLRARVSWNRVRSAEADRGGRRSRVLLVSGPPAVVQERFLCGYLATKLVFQLDEVVQRGASDDGRRVLLELRFGSFRCQAEAARMALMREFREEGVVCEYGWDPCEGAQGLV